VIPQVAPEQVWLDEHAGVLRAASKAGVRIYWNAADREDDAQRQISLVDQVVAGEYAGLVLAPAQQLALMLPVKRVLERRLPVVIVSSPLTLPPGPDLAYIVNDEDQTGALAARTIGDRLHGRGLVALLGIDPMQIAVMNRMRAFEDHLHREYPSIRVTERKPATHDALSSEQIATEALKATPQVDAALALDLSAAVGLYQAEQQLPKRRPITIVACGQDPELFNLLRLGAIQAFIAQDTFTMGYEAVNEVMRMRRGLPVPARMELKPIFITSANVDDPAILAHFATLPDEPL
jgi:ribose transport system substrate-binding protein